MGCVTSSPAGLGHRTTGAKVSPGREFSITEAYYAVEQEVDKLCTELTSKASDGVIGDYYDIMPGSLGAGAYAVVRQARNIKTGELVAVKTLSLQAGTKDSMKRARRRSETSTTGVSESEESIRNGGGGGGGYGRRRSTGENLVGTSPPGRAPSSGGGGNTFGTPSPPLASPSGATARDLQRTRSSQHELTLICREIDMLASLKHDCIVDLKEYFVCSTGSRIHIVLEILPGGDLKDNLAWSERDFFSESEARLVSKRILAGLEYLHSRNCVHRDLKFENLLLKERGNLRTVKIVDFGFARQIGRQSMGIRAWTGSSGGNSQQDLPPVPTPGPGGTRHNLRSLCGTPAYIAPEVIGMKQSSSGGPIRTHPSDGYDSAADMWSFGVVLYQMLSGTVPFDAPDQAGLFEEIKRGVVDMGGEEWEGISEDAKNLIRRLLVVDPRKRLTATQALLNDPWLNYFKRAPKRGSQSSLNNVSTNAGLGSPEQ